MTAEAGQTLGGLVLRHKIAEGGMGTVWTAEHVGLSRDVAVKFLLRTALDSPEAVQRFTHEAQTLAKISSPHTPQVFDYGIAADGTPYIVMELIAGMDLAEWMHRWGVMSVAEVARLVEQVASALAAAHNAGVIHRDIKLENIMLTGARTDFHAKVIDFGIAKSHEKKAVITSVGVAVGTPDYMSPEQLAGHPVDARSDMWSVGVVAYRCLTGHLPFEGESSRAIYLAIQRGHPAPVSELRPDVPQAIDEWFERVLAYEPENRFETIELMSRMLNVAAATAAESPGDAPASRVLSRRRRSDSMPITFAEVSGGGKTTRTARRDTSRVTQFAVSGAVLGLCVALGVQLAPSRARSAEGVGGKAGSFAESRSSGATGLLGSGSGERVPFEASLRAAETSLTAAEVTAAPIVARPSATAQVHPPAPRPNRRFHAPMAIPPSPAPPRTAERVASSSSSGSGVDWTPSDNLGEP
jgi:serine/threonine-protein kinase